MQRLKTRAQFQAALAGKIVARTPHFALHQRRWKPSASALPEVDGATGEEWQALFGVGFDDAWLGAMAPKRWARRAVTRNQIKRQIYGLQTQWQQVLPLGAYVVRLRAAFDRKQFPSARSEALRQAVRAELLSLLEQVERRKGFRTPVSAAPEAPEQAAIHA